MRSIRGGSGLGDSLYVQAVARHLVRRGQKLVVCSDWPDVFRPLGDRVRVEPFRRIGVDIVAHYSLRKGVQETDQFEDCCIQAGIREPVELTLDWPAPAVEWDRPVVCVGLPRLPMGRTDGFGAEVLPDCAVVQKAIDQLRGRATLVQIGKGESLHRLEGIDVDLANQTTVAGMIDAAAGADAFLGYCSFLVPLAESFGKPALFVWSRRGERSRDKYVRQITPGKVLHRESSRWIYDDASDEQIRKAADALLR